MLMVHILHKEIFLGAVKLTKTSDLDNYKCSAYDIRFDANGSFPLSDFSGFGKNVITFGADLSS